MKRPVQEWERMLAGKPPLKNGFTSELEHKVRERIYMQKEARKAPYRAMAALMSLVMLLGCGWWFRDDVKELLKPDTGVNIPTALQGDPLGDKEYHLKIHQFEQMGNFEYTIRRPFIIRHPSVQLTMADAPFEYNNDPDKFKAWMDKEQPDILQLPMSLYTELAAEGRLKPLDTLVRESKFDLDTLHAPLVEMLRQLAGGTGELYGLAADFGTMGLYVNEDLFAKYGVPLPDGELSADEILQLAKRFQGTDAGGLGVFDRGNKFSLIQLLGQASGLQLVAGDAEDGLKATVDSDAWKTIWRDVAAGLQEGWVTQGKPVDYGKNGITMKELGKQDPFAKGEVAMAIAPSYYYTNLETFGQEGVMTANWSTMPIRIDSSATNQELFMGTNTVYAINAASTQTEADWAMLSFIVSGAWMKGLDNPLWNSVLMADRSVMNQAASKHWKAFYEADVDPVIAAGSYRTAADKQMSKANALVYSLGGEEMEAVVKNGVSVDEAVEAFQTKLSAQLAGLKGGE
ncbi:ABC transporter substrate-binding protein [Paenibacillus silvisoli]|uniref:ABC transporter substrate-binding protein n=1 Tax=Paenibacillus silvisoli TaxID=3110539 RepID=UPI002804D83D|nr:extracellular solute-binding protein [Paenibacillus silvisoli]